MPPGAAQMTLPLDGQAAYSFDDFVPGRNSEAQWLCRQIGGRHGERLVYLWGPHGCGKSHLLHAIIAAQPRAARAMYVSMPDLQRFGPGALVGLDDADLLCLDDVDAAAADIGMLHGLFDLYNRARAGDRSWVVSAKAPAPAIAMALPDLASRLAGGVTIRLHHLDDVGRALALQSKARARGFQIPDEVARFVLARLDRDMHRLSGFVDCLARESLVAKRRITVPFVSHLLANAYEPAREQRS